jgi:DNA-binding HxlR family transcriptional regulator
MSSYLKRTDGTIVFLVHFTLKPGRDDRLIQLVKTAPPRSLARQLRELLNSGMAVREPVITTRRKK